MIESPVRQQLKDEWTREAAHEAALETRRRSIVDVLVARFGTAAEEVDSLMESINDDSQLKELVTFAAVCPELEAFRRRVSHAGG